MSKINIQGIVDDIKGHSVYTPLLEAIVNSIQAIEQGEIKNGKVKLVFDRESSIDFGDDALPEIKNVHIIDNGAGFLEENRESFDTYRGDWKKDIGGKGFGRFMFLKFFTSVSVESVYKNKEGIFYKRNFRFGRKYSIVEEETNKKLESNPVENSTTVHLMGITSGNSLEKQLETIGRKLLESLLIFFIEPEFKCPEIVLEEADGSHSVSLNKMLTERKEIQLLEKVPFTLSNGGKEEEFIVNIFKVYYSKKKSKIALAAQKRVVTSNSIHNFIPEFEEDFYEEEQKGEKTTQKNYVIKAYVIGDYLTEHVSLERDKFNFGKDKPDMLYPFCKNDVEAKAAEIIRESFINEVSVRSDKKKASIMKHVNEVAPWHKPYIDDVDFTNFSYNATAEKIELELQQYKLKKEIQTKVEIQEILSDPEMEYSERIESILENITQLGKSDLAHYVSNRKVILDIFDLLRKRKDDGSAKLEKDIHNLIFPMGNDSTDINYEEHNLWLLDERLVFTDYVASDRKIGGKAAPKEPDLVVFDRKRAFRAGENEYSNALTVFEFKRPKRTTYGPGDDPIIQVANYVNDIRSGKYETPEGVETIKVNEYTPVYDYIVCDIVDKIKEFAKNASLTPSPDGEGFFGFHPGHNIYFEIVSFKKLVEDARLRNKIFFKKLHIE